MTRRALCAALFSLAACGGGRGGVAVTVSARPKLEGAAHLVVTVTDEARSVMAAPADVAVTGPIDASETVDFTLGFDRGFAGKVNVNVLAEDAQHAPLAPSASGEATVIAGMIVPLAITIGSQPDDGGVDLEAPDAAQPDTSASNDLLDAAQPDATVLDLIAPSPDLAVTSRGDLLMPDLATPDLATPDLAAPDLARPDLATPDLATPDLAAAGPRFNVVTLPPMSDPSAPSGLVVGRLFGGGSDDIAFCSRSTSEVFVATATAKDKWTSAVAYPTHSANANPSDLLLLDVNSDGAKDVVIVDGSTATTSDGTSHNGISVFINNSTTRSLQPAVVAPIFPLGTVGTSLAFVTADNGGRSYLAIAMPGSQGAVAWATGASTSPGFFNYGGATLLNVTMPSLPSGIVRADLDNNGVPDIVADTSDGTQTQALIMNLPFASSGPPPGTSSLFANVAVSRPSPRSMAIGDLGQGHPSMVVAGPSALMVAGPSATSGTFFAPPASYFLNASKTGAPRSVALGTLDGDSFLDVAATVTSNADNQLLLFLNSGDGKGTLLTPPIAIALSAPGADVVADDVDFDGDTDLVVTLTAAPWLVVLLNQQIP